MDNNPVKVLDGCTVVLNDAIKEHLTAFKPWPICPENTLNFKIKITNPAIDTPIIKRVKNTVIPTGINNSDFL